MKRFLLQHLFFVHRPSLGYPESNDSDESNKEESDELGYESGSSGKFGTGLCGLLCGVGFYIGMTIYINDL